MSCATLTRSVSLPKTESQWRDETEALERQQMQMKRLIEKRHKEEQELLEKEKEKQLNQVSYMHA